MENNQTTEINSGSIIKFKGGFYRVTRCTKNTVNLSSVFSGQIYYKGMPKAEVIEAEAEWYNQWSQSDSYKCM